MRTPDKICQYSTKPHFLTVIRVGSPASSSHSRNCQPPTPPPPKKIHLINNICFQGSSPLLLFHLCLGYHSNYSQSSVIPSLYISALSHDWLPASTLIIAGGNTQKVAASCFLLQSTKLPSCFTFPPSKHVLIVLTSKAEKREGYRGRWEYPEC